MSGARTLFDKIWDDHVIRDLGDGWSLLQVDRHLLHDLSGPPALKGVIDRGLKVRDPQLVFATPDHIVSSEPGRTGQTFAPGAALYGELKTLSQAAGAWFFDLGQVGQGIVHVMAPEMGIALPGSTLICGDSHTCTNGGLGALAFGVGTTESTHALATGALRLCRPKRMRVTIDGKLGLGVAAKDVILHVLRTLGASSGVGHSVEFAGSTVRDMTVESRLTLCNLAVELGARSGIVAPDDTTFTYLSGRRFAPHGAAFDRAVAEWRKLVSDELSVFDQDFAISAHNIAPTVTWGTSPDQGMPVDAVVPELNTVADPVAREAMANALAYMDVRPGEPILGLPIEWVFIGSCTNSRLSDLRAAAAVARGRRVCASVTAWVVPGSVMVQQQAESEGLDQIFRDAGFQWREPGCSLCVAANGERIPPGARCVSTSNRNFVGRQGPRARTHLASPASAAAAAIQGVISDVRAL